ncbi:hypothetical protein K505DRAFT_7598 [Melanomma pulvis-pyrius CBS 109.77]|uniref:Uncharacterized protein n=1 Tax=Melanomma pulvis-pyrius CBS 109.77 TaxID=1314802 RepID=A0A6A6XV06_9PLEO|nr:hypothetical protein K505DRAFT_7598 [Melanomma pulvis-pyrius CBS 109.77]
MLNCSIAQLFPNTTLLCHCVQYLLPLQRWTEGYIHGRQLCRANRIKLVEFGMTKYKYNRISIPHGPAVQTRGGRLLPLADVCALAGFGSMLTATFLPLPHRQPVDAVFNSWTAAGPPPGHLHEDACMADMQRGSYQTPRMELLQVRRGECQPPTLGTLNTTLETPAAKCWQARNLHFFHSRLAPPSRIITAVATFSSSRARCVLRACSLLIRPPLLWGRPS